MLRDTDEFQQDSVFAKEWQENIDRLDLEYDEMQAGTESHLQDGDFLEVSAEDVGTPIEGSVSAVSVGDDDDTTMQQHGTPATYAGVVDTPIKASMPAPAGLEDGSRSPMRKSYGLREPLLVEELLRQRDAGTVELEMGTHGVRGWNECISRIIFKKGGTLRAEVFKGLNASIKGKPAKNAALGEHVTQCFRDCGVVPRKTPGALFVLAASLQAHTLD